MRRRDGGPESARGGDIDRRLRAVFALFEIRVAVVDGDGRRVPDTELLFPVLAFLAPDGRDGYSVARKLYSSHGFAYPVGDIRLHRARREHKTARAGHGSESGRKKSVIFFTFFEKILDIYEKR